MRRAGWAAVAVMLGVLALAGCGSGGGTGAGSSRPGAGATMRSPAPSPTHPLLAGDVVVLDAGHNDGNFQHTNEINRLVDAGGFRKPCDTTGTETNAGYTEASFTFDVMKRLTTLLRAAGAKVVLTRHDNHSVGPCVNKRAAIGNHAHADVALSIHADGGPASGHGFHVMQPTDGHGHTDAIVAPSHRLALAVRNAYRSGTGMPTASYIGTDGINPRGDMAGLNLSTVPKVLLECGNMRNPADAKLLASADFRQKIATSLTAAITAYEGKSPRVRPTSSRPGTTR